MSILLRLRRSPLRLYGVVPQRIDQLNRFLQASVAKDDAATSDPTPASKRKKKTSAKKQNDGNSQPKVMFRF